MMVAISLAEAAAGSLIYGASSVAQARGAQGATSTRATITNPAYLCGLIGDLIAWLLSLAALRGLPLFVVQAVLASSLAVTAVLARWLLGSTLQRHHCVALLALVVSLSVLAGAGGTEGTRVSQGALAVGLLAVGVVLSGAAVTGWASSRATALDSGLSFSPAAIPARAGRGDLSALMTTGLGYEVLAFGAIGAICLARALELGDVTTVSAQLWSVEVLVPTAFGVAFLGDRIRSGWWPAMVAAMAITVWTTCVLGGVRVPGPGATGDVSGRRWSDGARSSRDVREP